MGLLVNEFVSESRQVNEVLDCRNKSKELNLAEASTLDAIDKLSNSFFMILILF